MKPTQKRLTLFALLSVSLLTHQGLEAAPAGEAIFPAPTVGFVSIANPADFEARFNQTQIGQLAQDESMRAFSDHLQNKLWQQLGNIEQRLGVKINDLNDAAGGELAAGLIHRDGKRASVALTLDTTGKQAEATALLAKIDAEFAKQRATKRTETVGNTTMNVYKLAPKPQQRIITEVVYFRQGDLLVGVDNLTEAQAILAAITGNMTNPLAKNEAYATTMRRCVAEAKGMQADARWFIDPFGFDAARRSLRIGRQFANRKDTATIMREQGFDAVKGLGGHVSIAVDAERDFVHRTAVYAPPKPGTAGKSAMEKYNLAMRMAELPNRADLDLQTWAPRMTATYSTFNIDIQNAFDNLATMFDAMAGYEEAFKTTLEGFEKDPFGPKIKVRDEIIANLGSRVTLLTDYNLPITPDCERYLFVIEAVNTAALAGPIGKMMENDGAEQKETRGIAYWELAPETEELTATDLDDGLLSIDDTGAESNTGNDRVLRRAAVCLHEGNLVIASDVAYLEQVLFGAPDRETMAESEDYQFAMQHLKDLAPNKQSGWAFLRNDETVRPTYELIRAGKMPQSQTFFGRMLNEALTTPEDEEQGIVRKQRIDGSTLPSYELARRYFGPSARAIRSDDDGWFVTGVVLNKTAQ